MMTTGAASSLDPSSPRSLSETVLRTRKDASHLSAPSVSLTLTLSAPPPARRSRRSMCDQLPLLAPKPIPCCRGTRRLI